MALFTKKPGAPAEPGKHGGLGGLFGKPKEKAAGPSLEVGAELNAVVRRLKLLEEQFTNIRRKQQMLEQNMLQNSKKAINENKLLNDDIIEMRETLGKIEDKAVLIIKELKLCAKKDEVDLLKKYVNLWEPVNFVTKKEVSSIVENALDARKT